VFVLPKAHYDAIIEQALAETPFECCGILAGKDGRVLRRYPTANARRSLVEYAIDPRELLRIIREIEDNDWQVVGIYHSHTRTEARPSWKDISAAGYPEARYLIVSLRDPARPRLRAFRIEERQPSPAVKRRLEREQQRLREVAQGLPEAEQRRIEDEWWSLNMVTQRRVREEELVIGG
jgi:proteasome lid subunit RPN8/RPN11